MNLNRIKKIFLISFILLTAVFTLNSIDASSIGITAGYTSLTVGNSTTITVTGNDAIGRVNISSSNSNIVSVSTGSLWVEGSASFKVTAKAVGNATITITPVDMATASGNTASVGAKSITIYSNAVYVDTRNTNNNLATLTVEGHELNFDKNNTNYTLDVDFNIDELKIDASAEDYRASVKVESNTGLVPGENVVKVICTAENESQKVYEIKVNKAKNPEDVNAFLKSLDVKNSKLKNEFSKEKFEYLLEDVDGSIEKLDLELITEIEGVKTEISGNDKLEIGFNHIIIKVISKDESTVKEYHLYVYKTEEILSLVNVEEDKSFFEKNKVLCLCLLVIAILIVVIIILVIKNLKYSKNMLNAPAEEKVENRRHRRGNTLNELSNTEENDENNYNE